MFTKCRSQPGPQIRASEASGRADKLTQILNLRAHYHASFIKQISRASAYYAQSASKITLSNEKTYEPMSRQSARIYSTLDKLQGHLHFTFFFSQLIQPMPTRKRYKHNIPEMHESSLNNRFIRTRAQSNHSSNQIKPNAYAGSN
ncbi:hypothetical protein EUGRSUZ_J00154 [Eucalyptus grandis]|uniref:Uncharacterized protein n=2 Tax=Eucalyptus grandis TaxID=71139 RepID=A0ACC3J2F7_EUCGR|nr:hypothetical protein EUGRSUZ_J00154 [Eucalyptus grandis]